MIPKIIPLHDKDDECSLLHAVVKGVSKESFMIDTGSGVVNSRAAFSCLVAPQVGDTVLVNHSASDYYLLAVLDRPSGQDMTLAFPADVKFHVTNGQFDLLATKDINLMTTAKTRMLSGDVDISAATMDVNTGKLTTRTQEVESYSQNVKLHTHALSTVAKQISQKTDILIRWVENVETLNIGNLIQNVRKNYTSHSNQAVITAKKDVRIDGERIHMG